MKKSLPDKQVVNSEPRAEAKETHLSHLEVASLRKSGLNFTILTHSCVGNSETFYSLQLHLAVGVPAFASSQSLVQTTERESSSFFCELPPEAGFSLVIVWRLEKILSCLKISPHALVTLLERHVLVQSSANECAHHKVCKQHQC